MSAFSTAVRESIRSGNPLDRDSLRRSIRPAAPRLGRRPDAPWQRRTIDGKAWLAKGPGGSIEVLNLLEDARKGRVER